MAEIIEMPKLSDTMTVGTIVNWLKKEGDEVAIGDMLCEVETDKATMELENLVADGVLLKVYIQESGEAPVGAPLCAIGEKGESAPEVDLPSSEEVEKAKSDSEDEEEPKEESKEEEKPEKDAKESKPEPQGRKQESKPAEEAPAPKSDGGRVKISPLAKKLADEKGVDISLVKGSGPGGRIVKADVEEAIKNPPAAPAAKSSAAPAQLAGAPIAEEGPIKVTNMRKAIATALVKSKQENPHFYLETEVDAAALIKLRADLNKDLAELAPEKGGIKLTVNDFILKASAEALRRVPGVNCSWMGDTIQQHGSVHMAFGVAVPDGLVTPVIRDAHLKGLRQISAEAKELIKKARDKKLKPDEMSGSTFTVTNLGMFGVTGFYGIINPPNAAILSVGATIEKPGVKNGEIVVGQRMAIGLSGDHRVIDGATGAMFLQALQTVLETPALMLV